MPIPKVRNLAEIRRQNPLVYEAIKDLMDGMTNISNQTNSHPNKAVDPPPQFSGISVTGSAGYHDVQIQDNAPTSRGAHNFLEWSLTKDFTDFKTIQLGPARNWRGALGVSGPVYFRAYPSFATSAPAPPIYYGSQSAPQGVDAGGVTLAVKVTGITAGAATVNTTATGVIAGPTPQAGTGSGTEPSVQPQGAAGFGFTPTRLPAKTGSAIQELE